MLPFISTARRAPENCGYLLIILATAVLAAASGFIPEDINMTAWKL